VRWSSTSTCSSATRRTSTLASAFEADGDGDESFLELDVDRYRALLEQVMARYPGMQIVASTLRQVRSASVNDWSAVCATRDGFHAGAWMEGLEIYDRVGGGDSFASGLIYGLLAGADVDTSMARLDEVRRVMAGGAARVVR
jgi:2-dehydro-3-deoxygluconokinase